MAANKPVTISGLSISGASAPNYTLTQPASTATISAASLSVTANSTGKTYGASDVFAGTEFGVSGTLYGGDAVSSVSLASDGAASTAAVGSYAIVPSAAQGSGLGNYNITYNNGTLSVGAAGLVITANSTSKTYGLTNIFAGTEFTSTGLLNGDAVSSVSLSSDGSANTAPVNSYPILAQTAQGSGLGNYNITYNNGTLTVTPALLTVTANDTNRVMGRPTRCLRPPTVDL